MRTDTPEHTDEVAADSPELEFVPGQVLLSTEGDGFVADEMVVLVGGREVVVPLVVAPEDEEMCRRALEATIESGEGVYFEVGHATEDGYEVVARIDGREARELIQSEGARRWGWARAVLAFLPSSAPRTAPQNRAREPRTQRRKAAASKSRSGTDPPGEPPDEPPAVDVWDRLPLPSARMVRRCEARRAKAATW